MSNCKDGCGCNSISKDAGDFDNGMLGYLESKTEKAEISKVSEEKPEPKILCDELELEDYIHYPQIFGNDTKKIEKCVVTNNYNTPFEFSFGSDNSIKVLNETDYELRKFDSGAIRDTNIGKLEYYGFFSPLVMKRFAEYMGMHRKLPDGSLRGSDNWKGLFGEEHSRVCFDSLLRHLMDVWLIMDNYQDEARDSMEEALCAMSFNINALLLKLLIDKKNKSEDISNG